nr:CD63 antigen-like isoform X2 [Megalopta genalis]
MSCVSGCIKWMLFIVNFLILICGVGILTIGVLAHLQLASESKDFSTPVAFPAITLIVLGSIIFVISFFGCCGAIRESHCMTITFASFLLLILLIQVAVAVFAFVVVKDADVREQYVIQFDKYHTSNSSKQVVDLFQEKLECCGIDSPNDYHELTLPASCCGQKEAVCLVRDAYQQGCVTAMKNMLHLIGSVLGGVAIAVAAVELVGIIFALCLANSIKNTERRGYRV